MPQWSITVPDIQQGTAYCWYNVLAPPDGTRMLVDATGNPVVPNASTWAATSFYALGQEIWDGAAVEICIVPGTSAASPPSWGAQGSTIVDGTAVWQNLGAPVPLGTSQGEATFSIGSKEEETVLDQQTAPVDAIMTGESASIDLTLLEVSLQKVAYGLANALYSSGTDSGLPSGAQSYEQIDVGGLTALGGTAAPGGAGTFGAFPAISIISPRRSFTNPGKYLVCTLYSAYPKDVHKIGFTRTKMAVWKVTFAGLLQPWRSQRKQVAQYWRAI